jgi:NADP-dependent 3-hydroxy acid dehydrogenase YdfG
MELNGQIAVITGVSKGIGRSVALQLLAAGCKVYGLGRNRPDMDHPEFSFMACDVRRLEEVESCFAKIFKAEGNRVDILINNAGLGYFGYCEEMPIEQWDEMFQTNVNGMFYCTRQVLAGMKERQYGQIVNIASIAGLEGYQQVSGYCATKFAVRGFSDALYKEVREDGVRVTCVYPGSVKTDFFRNSENIKPHDYMLDPDDVAGAMVNFLRMPLNFHTVNLEIRPLQPKGPRKPDGA